MEDSNFLYPEDDNLLEQFDKFSLDELMQASFADDSMPAEEFPDMWQDEETLALAFAMQNNPTAGPIKEPDKSVPFKLKLLHNALSEENLYTKSNMSSCGILSLM